MNKNTEGKRRNLKKTFLIVSCVLLSVLLVILIGVTAYLESMLGLINKKDPDAETGTLSSSELDEILNQTDENDPSFTGETIDEDDVIWDNASGSQEQGENIIQILLIGQDRREGEGRARSDAMILCTLNKSAKTLTLTSFMRDMYVQIPGYQDNRINVSYALGGMKLLNKCLEKNFAVSVDGNVEVDFKGFEKVIDLLGGVDINLTKSEANYLNRRGNWDVENNAGTWNLKAGVNRLNGSQALAYSRIRDVGNGDFGRTNRQRVVLSTILEKAKSMSFSKINSLLNEVLPTLTTDLSDSEILNYVVQIFPLLSDLTVVTHQIPAEGTYKMTSIRGMSVLLPDLAANREILEKAMKE